MVAEARADAALATALADRTVVERGPQWLDAATCEAMRRWEGIEAGSELTRWREIPALAKQRRLRTHPRGNGADAAAAHKAMLLAQLHGTGGGMPAALLLLRDADTQPERRANIAGERDALEPRLGFPVVVGVADPKREAWVLHGFDPSGPTEEKALAAMIAETGLDPRSDGHRLRGDSRRGSAERDLKQLLGRLAGEYERERRCWEEAPLEVLTARGERTGLAAFLGELEGRLVPLYSGSSLGERGHSF